MQPMVLHGRPQGHGAGGAGSAERAEDLGLEQQGLGLERQGLGLERQGLGLEEQGLGLERQGAGRGATCGTFSSRALAHLRASVVAFPVALLPPLPPLPPTFACQRYCNTGSPPAPAPPTFANPRVPCNTCSPRCPR